ncbi:hypothetical protein QFZ24_000163 [Streptomyces phaeochromogenes]|uniref:hypothetical protein n=1 Tax=Streptomyces phaeochromogenes TaxID=1923 RepID=UPI00279425A7|nr:hypothetical protein [Streptomyces phaeochromogenes]MDQ0946240.1 hypothetical protein [Streptomyces phaeochromogenes]
MDSQLLIHTPLTTNAAGSHEPAAPANVLLVPDIGAWLPAAIVAVLSGSPDLEEISGQLWNAGDPGARRLVMPDVVWHFDRPWSHPVSPTTALRYDCSPHTGDLPGDRRMTRSGSRYQQQMIKNVLRGLAAAALVVLPLTAAPPAHAAETVPLATAVDRLTPGTESREGYQRTSFKH